MIACFIDLRKAYYTVWPDRLFLKLQKVGIHGSQGKVKCQWLMSDAIGISKVAYQGNVLIFINDLGDYILDTESPVLYDICYMLMIYCF